MSDESYDPKKAAAEDLAAARESDLWDAAVKATSDALDEDDRKLVLGFDEEDWIVQHFTGGMAFRNWLRERGYGEEDLGVRNLDNVYVEILKEAATLEPEDEE